MALTITTLDTLPLAALTLRSIAGLSTAAIARAFLDRDTTMGQRLTRAKAKIAAARIPFDIPDVQDWPHRLARVQDVIWLIFNAGYVPPSGNDPAADLCDEAIFLCRLLDNLRPGDPEIEGMLAMLLFIHARRGARRLAVSLSDQDPALLAEAQACLDRAIARRQPGPFQILAAIQALHTDGRQGGATDWAQITLLYRGALSYQDTPVIRLNLAVALAETGHLHAALQAIDALGLSPCQTISPIMPHGPISWPAWATRAPWLPMSRH